MHKLYLDIDGILDSSFPYGEDEYSESMERIIKFDAKLVVLPTFVFARDDDDYIDGDCFKDIVGDKSLLFNRLLPEDVANSIITVIRFINNEKLETV